ncbi:MAG: UDP-3-O-acyl-N-acetylglucosamine deacetylase, partial [Desulfuromonadales bacterium]|nr:UDP-3-O-acyl-N-acetylglucosamine deacetylase [Desulfuromonadales bacterium]
MLYQTTLAQSITFDGIGLHSGRAIRMTLRPAEAGRGIVFHRSEGTKTVSIEAISANVVDTR